MKVPWCRALRTLSKVMKSFRLPPLTKNHILHEEVNVILLLIDYIYKKYRVTLDTNDGQPKSETFLGISN